MVEYFLAKENVAGSTPVVRYNLKYTLQVYYLPPPLP